MGKSIVVLNGHPHRDKSHLCCALAEAYASGAKKAGHKVKTISIAEMDIPFLRDPEDMKSAAPKPVADAQKAVKAADHVVIVYPLWCGTMPALVKAFFEQLCRNSFAIVENPKGGWPQQMLKGKSARAIVTMGMPAAAYRLFFGAHGVKSLDVGILGMAGFRPVKDTLIGGADGITPKQAARLFERMRALGEKAA